ncbi:MAG TPA: hypothetical protein PK079_15460 [Leptospiraceae bacterium]|nr:hypothetical protein [Leptospiraceae bacterium]HMW06066.1 hypothetical protein [Leptospiraceae bacterium]HMX33354.1 hypothetical protein [Leptospiraceae bacterium]HMY31392.1 hypothetical protein [Leptospiraceae bacterium]HMZ64988.1 hypothetical protein [Leptospiraceae bacterium]
MKISLNSFTNFLHAVALASYTWLVYNGLIEKRPHYDIYILTCFALLFVIKIFGIIVHIPSIENDRNKHNFFWIIISILCIVLNFATLKSINTNLFLVSTGTGIVAILAFLYIRSLFNSGGKFYLIASAFTLVHGACAIVTREKLSLAWFFLLMSNLLWIVFSKIPYLHKHKYHNDIYHFMLIGSTYYLYSTIESGLWKSPIF